MLIGFIKFKNLMFVGFLWVEEFIWMSCCKRLLIFFVFGFLKNGIEILVRDRIWFRIDFFGIGIFWINN